MKVLSLMHSAAESASMQVYALTSVVSTRYGTGTIPAPVALVLRLLVDNTFIWDSIYSCWCRRRSALLLAANASSLPGNDRFPAALLAHRQHREPHRHIPTPCCTHQMYPPPLAHARGDRRCLVSARTLKNWYLGLELHRTKVRA